MFTYTLGTYPYSLATPGGCLIKTCKSKLLQLLEKDHAPVEVKSVAEKNPVWIFDAMAVLQQLVNCDASTFGEFAEKVLSMIQSIHKTAARTEPEVPFKDCSSCTFPTKARSCTPWTRSKGGQLNQLLLMQAMEDQELKDWLEQDTNVTHHQCVEDMHQLFAHQILQTIIEDISRSVIFAVIVDGTQDISGVEQESVCIRYVDDFLQVHEGFIGFHKLEETTGRAISSMIFDVMLRLEINKDNLRGQTYDGAVNMGGKYNGAQALIREKCPLALHFRCAALPAHILNLVAERTCAADIFVRDALDWLNELGKLYKQSGKYTTKFQHIATDHDQASPSPATLKPLCPTRFLCRRKAFILHLL
ncbi:putative zinc finger MYM-type protein 1-like [Apostichopus japonicus]|uniref:Putative zinc finger MYM-type protein 1-like n=1 Tax=Stichopus japonicus TaxID=307972 RepID=A0A2G8JFZ4_STIJA|nr:putative zinc finger MYM-type protein 1-like [Apostichopus japonicus]